MATAEKLEADEQLVKLTESLFDNLRLELPDNVKTDFNFLKSDEFYIEVFKAILSHGTHPFREAEFERETRGMSPADRIQTLINKLASEVLHIDLSHIKGEKITKGNKKHIGDMLQLLDALSQNIRHEQGPSNGEEEEISADKDELNETGSVIQEQELNDLSDKKPYGGDKNKHDNPELFKKMMDDGKLVSEVRTDERSKGVKVHPQDPVNYNQVDLVPKYGKRVVSGGRKSHQQPKANRRQTGGLSRAGMVPVSSGYRGRSKKQEVVRRIEENIYPVHPEKALRTRTLDKKQATQNKLSQGVYNHMLQLSSQGDGIDPSQPGHYDLETIRQYLDSKHNEDEVAQSMQRQKAKYRHELQDYIAFNKKVTNRFNPE